VTQAPLLIAHGLTAGYGKMDILHDVSLDVDAGEIVSIIGPNGAGKSTAFKTIVGFLRPRQGRVIFNGAEITGLRPDLVLRRGLAYVPQGRIVFPQMTVLENLEMGAYTERDAARVAAALVAIGSTPVPASHEVVRLVLGDGRVVYVSGGHPTTDGRRVGDLAAGDGYDGATVASAERVRYDGGATFDVLPAGATGAYWANGVLLGSTLR